MLAAILAATPIEKVSHLVFERLQVQRRRTYQPHPGRLGSVAQANCSLTQGQRAHLYMTCSEFSV